VEATATGGAPAESQMERVRTFATEKLDALLGAVRSAKAEGGAVDFRASTEGPFADLTSLLACDALGEGFGALAGALWFAARKGDKMFRGAQLAACEDALTRLRDRPSLPREEAWGLIDGFEAAGLDPNIHAFNRLAELSREEGNHDDDR